MTDRDLTLPDADDEPAEWVEWETDWTATDDEVAAGNQLGDTIDVDDRNDQGDVQAAR